MSWTLTPAGTYTVQIRDDIDAALGTSVQWDGTVDGAWTIGAGELAFQVDQAQAMLMSTMLLDTAPAEVVIARAIDAGLTPKPATYSRYVVRSAGSGTLPTGTVVQDPSGYRWSVIDPTAYVLPGADVTIEAVEAGATSLPSSASLSLVVPVTGITSLTYLSSDGDAYQVGRDAETTAQLRVRVRREEAARAGSPDAVSSAVRALDWVVAVNAATPSPGYASVSVAPGPVGADQEAEIAGAIYGAVALGVLTAGTSSSTTTDINGDPVAIYYTEGNTESVPVVVTLTPDGTVSDAGIESAAQAAIESEFALLGPGDPIYRLRVLGALDLPGVTAVALTIHGGSADSVSPASAADVLAASPITITVA